MKVLIKEKLSPHKYKTPEGYLICQDSILARTGPQEYLRSELFPGDDSDEIISVDRKPEQVFSEQTLASFENKPITVEHPMENVTPENYRELSVGFARDIKRGKADGQDVILGNLIITDAETIENIEQGIRTELSCGYDCDITDGPHPEQINIRGNHIALCEQGRAGIAKIVDSSSSLLEEEKETMNMIISTLKDGSNVGHKEDWEEIYDLAEKWCKELEEHKKSKNTKMDYKYEILVGPQWLRIKEIKNGEKEKIVSFIDKKGNVYLASTPTRPAEEIRGNLFERVKDTSQLKKYDMKRDSDDDYKYVIFKENGLYNVTDYDNFIGPKLDEKIEEFDEDFTTFDECVDYLVKNRNLKKESIMNAANVEDTFAFVSPSSVEGEAKDAYSKSFYKKKKDILEEKKDDLENEEMIFDDEEDKEKYEKAKKDLLKSIKQSVKDEKEFVVGNVSLDGKIKATNVLISKEDGKVSPHFVEEQKKDIEEKLQDEGYETKWGELDYQGKKLYYLLNDLNWKTFDQNEALIEDVFINDNPEEDKTRNIIDRISDVIEKSAGNNNLKYNVDFIKNYYTIVVELRYDENEELQDAERDLNFITNAIFKEVLKIDEEEKQKFANEEEVCYEFENVMAETKGSNELKLYIYFKPLR